MRKPNHRSESATKTTDRTPRPLLAVPQVAELLNVQPRHIYRLVAERRIPFIKLGKLLRFEPDAIREWIDASQFVALR